MKPGCLICKTGGDRSSCTCTANCMYPSCQWRIVARVEKVTEGLKYEALSYEKTGLEGFSTQRPSVALNLDLSKNGPVSQPESPRPHSSLGPHDHAPPDYSPDCGCSVCHFYIEMAKNNPPSWPDPIEHRNEGNHYWGDTHFNRVPGPPINFTRKDDTPENAGKEDTTLVQATLQ